MLDSKIQRKTTLLFYNIQIFYINKTNHKNIAMQTLINDRYNTFYIS